MYELKERNNSSKNRVFVVKGSTVDTKFTADMLIIRNNTTITSCNLYKPETNRYTVKSGCRDVNSNAAWTKL